ncbi:MAG: C39 family peptidase [Candidatus Rokubacteria bacterium]|nr:C39 family peptidase [Candidatus Rokubacteria bacterium]
MHTDLFALAHGIGGGIVGRVVPPGCRTPLEGAGSPIVSEAGTIQESPVWRPGRPARHFVPALSVLAPSVPAFRFELTIETRGEWAPWVAAAPIGGDDFTPALPATGTLSCDVDVFTASVPADAVRLRVRARGPLVAPWLMTLSACDLAPVARTAAPPGRARVTVPVRSQMIEPEPTRRHICSPTSVAMVLERWGRRVETLALAAEIFQPALGRYGVWPAAVAAAGRHGIAGYLMRFPDWGSAAWCLDAGLPIVASVRYAGGELAGAAMDHTDGHLVVVTGYEDGAALLNDPAAPTAEEVPRRVRIEDLERVWLERTGVGYVLFDPLQVG